MSTYLILYTYLMSILQITCYYFSGVYLSAIIISFAMMICGITDLTLKITVSVFCILNVTVLIVFLFFGVNVKIYLGRG